MGWGFFTEGGKSGRNLETGLAASASAARSDRSTLERYAEGIGGKLRVSIDLPGEEIPLEA